MLKIGTYISSNANEVRNPKKSSINISGWGADFADPINYIGQETYNDDAAYFSTVMTGINDATDPDLIAEYEEFTRLVYEAKAITDDIDARYAAFAKAEAYFIEHALSIPANYKVEWELTKINPYSKVYPMYGIQENRYINWETSTEPVNSEMLSAYAAAYEAE